MRRLKHISVAILCAFAAGIVLQHSRSKTELRADKPNSLVDGSDRDDTGFANNNPRLVVLLLTSVLLTVASAVWVFNLLHTQPSQTPDGTIYVFSSAPMPVTLDCKVYPNAGNIEFHEFDCVATAVWDDGKQAGELDLGNDSTARGGPCWICQTGRAFTLGVMVSIPDAQTIGRHNVATHDSNAPVMTRPSPAAASQQVFYWTYPNVQSCAEPVNDLVQTCNIGVTGKLSTGMVGFAGANVTVALPSIQDSRQFRVGAGDLLPIDTADLGGDLGADPFWYYPDAGVTRIEYRNSPKRWQVQSLSPVVPNPAALRWEVPINEPADYSIRFIDTEATDPSMQTFFAGIILSAAVAWLLNCIQAMLTERRSHR